METYLSTFKSLELYYKNDIFFKQYYSWCAHNATAHNATVRPQRDRFWPNGKCAHNATPHKLWTKTRHFFLLKNPFCIKYKLFIKYQPGILKYGLNILNIKYSHFLTESHILNYLLSKFFFVGKIKLGRKLVKWS